MKKELAMAFEWHKLYKHEENIESDVTDRVFEYVCEYYNVEEITDLTEEQISEIDAFRDKLNEFSVMQIGFSNLVNQWESENYEAE